MGKRLVLKFGGSSVSTPEQIRQIAAKVTQLHRAGNELTVVVSAMGKTTDGLLKLAQQVSPHPNRRELDMLVSTGERVSMALMAMALHDQSTPSISFTGSQAGIFTDGDFSNAKIIEVSPTRVEAALRDRKVVVLAGFQGVDPASKEITTLGRGGSDTTAVAMAAHLKADRCEILKDVDGVFSADPKLVPHAKLFKEISLGVLLDFCFWGAKVLHYRSVELAIRQKVPLFVGRSDNFQLGTACIATLGEKGFMPKFESQEILGVNSHKEVHHISVTADETHEALSIISTLLKEQKLPWPQILASAFENGVCRMMYTADADTLSDIKNALTCSSKVKPGRVLSSVSATCYGAVGSDMVAQLAARLSSAQIPVEKTITSALTVSFFIEPQHREKAIQILHPENP